MALTHASAAPLTPFEAVGATITMHRADIRKPEDVAGVFDTVAASHGRAPDCVVANAGINVPPGPMASFPDERFRDLVEVNIVGAFNVLKAAAANVADGGTIIGLTTSLVRVAAPGLGPYSATKAAVECLLRSMSKELAGRKVRVNGVAPGPVDTDLFRSGKDEAAIQRSAAMNPFNRVGAPQEVAEVVSFLASDKASWVHGQIVQPNGGLV
ncbi:SDR family oxidoreductase [Aliiruegeria lutimaris]|uniref:3-oxoacyl-[acyl-carrier protein] reductase n=1 Tax=Aliiruegeria lutimaris TaxID=571298 RepID=A0A1G8S879_9RHOB|nr:SDR family oxidoreductase [Aliiruegeria lutimaris]SDJ24890.1 3-oxoacyl-[acyl-carrier protein] reductase [Aliiruegeria lutimaris]